MMNRFKNQDANKWYNGRKGKAQMFMDFAKANECGATDWVLKSDLPDELNFSNGWDWGRASSKWRQIFEVEVDRSLTAGTGVDRIRVLGVKDNINFLSQTIRQDIRDSFRGERCPITFISEVEIDHKDGRKDNSQVMNPETQTRDDFQVLSKAANDAKRQHCKVCRDTNKRFDATQIGYPKAFANGGSEYEGTCNGCFWYDVLEFRKSL